MARYIEEPDGFRLEKDRTGKEGEEGGEGKERGRKGRIVRGRMKRGGGSVVEHVRESKVIFVH